MHVNKRRENAGLSGEAWSRVHSGKTALIVFIVGLMQMVSDLPPVPDHKVLFASTLVVVLCCVVCNVFLIHEYYAEGF